MKIKHDYVNQKPTPSPKEGESLLEATLTGLTLIAAIVVWCAVLYLLHGG